MKNYVLALTLSLYLAHTALAAPVLISPDPADGSGGVGTPYNGETTTAQQIANSSAFSALTGPSLLTGINLNVSSGTFAGTVTGGTISVGLTNVAANAISTNLASNGGPLTQVAADYTPIANLGTYQYAIVFDTPFLYDPSAGNLLLQIFQPATLGISMETGPGTQSGRAYNSSFFGNDAPGGNYDIQYVFDVPSGGAPELSGATASLPFACLALGLLATRRRRSAA